MNDPNWWQIVPALVGGGAMGALLTAGITSFRGRRQPIGYRTNIIPIFHGSQGGSSLSAELTVWTRTDQVGISSLFVHEVLLINRGNRDFDRFTAGITFAGVKKQFTLRPSPPTDTTRSSSRWHPRRLSRSQRSTSKRPLSIGATRSHFDSSMCSSQCARSNCRRLCRWSSSGSPPSQSLPQRLPHHF